MDHSKFTREVMDAFEEHQQMQLLTTKCADILEDVSAGKPSDAEVYRAAALVMVRRLMGLGNSAFCSLPGWKPLDLMETREAQATWVDALADEIREQREDAE